MNTLVCDSEPLIASFNPGAHYHELHAATGQLAWEAAIPEPVLGETCNFLRNNVRNGPALEFRFLDAATTVTTDFQISTTTLEDRRGGAAELQAAHHRTHS